MPGARRKPSVAKRLAAKKPATKSTARKRPTAKGTVAKQKTAARKSTRKKTAVAKKGVVRRKPNATFMKAMTPSAVLAAVVGSMPMPRTEVTKKIWDYIKKNKLQDAINRRLINADDKLRMVFEGRRQVSMFELPQLLSKQLRLPGEGDDGTDSTGPRFRGRR